MGTNNSLWDGDGRTKTLYLWSATNLKKYGINIFPCSADCAFGCCRQINNSTCVCCQTQSDTRSTWRHGHTEKKLKMDFPNAVQVSFVLLHLTLVSCHPQCLDFKPPFENTKRLSFCSQYSDFGCCDGEKDGELQSRYTSIQVKLRAEGVTACDTYLKDILCQECSPYAIHIYDAETSGVWSRTFPGLCGNYCSTFHDQCASIVRHVTQDQSFVNALSNKTEFCQKVSLTDRDYCFPDLLTDPRLSGDISRTQITSQGCLCLEEFADQLANPVIFRTAVGDERIFIGEQVGIVHIYFRNKTKLSEPFLDLQDLVLTSSRNGDERGFLGLTFHPNFVKNKQLYVYFSIRSENREKIRISEFTVNETDANKINRSSERILLEVGEPWWNHNGGEVSSLIKDRIMFNNQCMYSQVCQNI